MIDKEKLKEKYREIKEKGSYLNNIRDFDVSKMFEGNYFQKFLEDTLFNGKRIGNDDNYKLLKKAFNEFLEIVYSENILKKRKTSRQDYQEIELFVSHSLNSFSILYAAIENWNKENKYLGYWIVLNLYLQIYELISKYLDEAIKDLGNFAKKYNKDIREKIEKGLKLTLYDFLISVGVLDKSKGTKFRKKFEEYIDYQLRNDIAHLNYIINEEHVLVGKKNKKARDISFFVNKVYELMLFLFVVIRSEYGLFAKLKSKIKSNPKARRKVKKDLEELKK